MPDYAWSFPQDGMRGARSHEWWYFTGHLEARNDPGRVFGYQFTVSESACCPRSPGCESEWSVSNLVMAHAAISDVTRREHRFSDLLYREAPLLGVFGAPFDPTIAKVIAPAGTSGLWTLKWNGAGLGSEMETTRGAWRFG